MNNLKFINVFDDLVSELYDIEHIDGPVSNEYKEGYKDAIIYAIDTLITGKSLPAKGNKWIVYSNEEKKITYGKNEKS